MRYYLLIDFGSTYTKLTAVDKEKGDIIATASSFTTVATDITVGYRKALAKLYQKIGKEIEFYRKIACSSAAGGLKMAAIGLVEELTVEAAKRVCLGAGAKVDLVFSHYCTAKELRAIIDKKIDIVLLAGGTDGGNSDCVLHNAKVLGEIGVKIPVIYAGNKSCQDEIEEIFRKYQIDGYICENVMPRLNVLNPHSAKEKIKEIFLKRIILAKGIKKIETEIDKVVQPTPDAVLQASELLSKGYLDEPGLGEIVLLDIGGATTDVYSMSPPNTTKSNVIVKGLEEPFAKRTVEGDLGMRYSAMGILSVLSKEEQERINRTFGIDIAKECEYHHEHVEDLPKTEKEDEIEKILAGVCADKAMERHCGKMEEVYTPLGMMYYQTGKDLSEIKYIIGTGAVVINSADPGYILSKMTNHEFNRMELRPLHPEYLIDQDYILAAMGLLSQEDPLLALQIMKKRMRKI
ncbi:MAG TPA: methylaspartate mutase accessory protein GlmL [Bacilli bacterium]|nr:methylaspartate mutase accessory protein GlmL [Bacilli bacterium]